MATARVYLSIGSNLGDRFSNLQTAVEHLAGVPEVTVAAVSDVYATDPVDRVDQPEFLNAAVAIDTGLGPLELLTAVKAIETQLGREPSERWAARSIDIDIVLWEQQVLASPQLTLPHAAFRERAFVLVPLAELAPNAVDPVTGSTVRELAARPGVKGTVRHSKEGLEPV